MKIRSLTLGLLSALLLLSTGVAAASATTFEGPNLAGNITVGGTAHIMLMLSVGTGSTISSSPYCPFSSSTCSFNVCPSTSNPSVMGGAQFEFYGIRQVFVTTPSGDQYQLGSSSRIFLADSSTTDGIGPVPMSPGGYAPMLTLGADDSFSLPFGPSLAYPLSFTSVDSGTWFPALSAYTVNPETGYYWWRTAIGGVGIPNQLISTNPTPAPTGQSGTYQMDIEGNVFCSNGTTVPFTIDNFFDIGHLVFNTPQFPVGMAAVVAVAFVGLLAVRKRNLNLPHF
jgi:hypothetical protein